MGIRACACFGVLLACAAVSAHGNSEIVASAKSGDAAAVRMMVRQKTDVNATEADGSTALLWAVYRADLETVRVLLAAKADVNAANRYGVTPLLQASRIGSTPLIEALLDAGADLKKAQRMGETPLMAAAGTGNIEAVKLFIERGVDVNAKEQGQGQTALMWASAAGHLEVVKILLAAHADPDLAARSLIMADDVSKPQGRSWPDFSRGGLTPLMFAVREGHFDVAKTLLDVGADPKIKTPTNLTAMLIAVVNDRLDLADMLLGRGADPNDGSLHEVTQLRNLRQDATAADASRPRPSHANRLTAIEFMAHLLDRGADANRVVTYTMNVDGNGLPLPSPVTASAYMSALALQDVEALRVLLAAQAVSPSFAAEKGGLTPLMLAIGAGRSGFGAPGRTRAPFRDPGERSASAAVNLLLEFGADVNGAAKNGDTALHRAAQTNDPALIKLLAQKGATLEARNALGLTPLDVAMAKRVPGAPEARDSFGDIVTEHPKLAAIAALSESLGLPDKKFTAISGQASAGN